MREFKLSFTATEEVYYETSVEANTPEEAIALFKEDQSIGEWHQDEQISCDIDIDSVKCEGEWIPDPSGHYSSSSLKKINGFEIISKDNMTGDGNDDHLQEFIGGN